LITKKDVLWVKNKLQELNLEADQEDYLKQQVVELRLWKKYNFTFMNLYNASRCEYCARIIYKNVSGTYKLCSLKCKKYFKKNKSNDELEKFILQILSKGWNEINVIFSTVNNIDKFKFISAIGRMVHFDKTLMTKSKNEISMRSFISKVKK
jgi:hypothetical protein